MVIQLSFIHYDIILLSDKKERKKEKKEERKKEKGKGRKRERIKKSMQ
jgi:hypothetical protein